jgi:hypothetical protein
MPLTLNITRTIYWTLADLSSDEYSMLVTGLGYLRQAIDGGATVHTQDQVEALKATLEEASQSTIRAISVRPSATSAMSMQGLGSP